MITRYYIACSDTLDELGRRTFNVMASYQNEETVSCQSGRSKASLISVRVLDINSENHHSWQFNITCYIKHNQFMRKLTRPLKMQSCSLIQSYHLVNINMLAKSCSGLLLTVFTILVRLLFVIILLLAISFVKNIYRCSLNTKRKLNN